MTAHFHEAPPFKVRDHVDADPVSPEAAREPECECDFDCAKPECQPNRRTRFGAEAAPPRATTPEPGLPSHITPVLRAQMQRWANRMRGRYGVPVYLVGSALREDNPDPRDWDFRLTLPDDEFALRFGSVDEWRDEGCTGNWTRTRFRWSDQCVKDTKDAFAWMHVNADVQIYPESQVAMLYADLPRVRIDSFPNDAEARAPLAGSPSRESGALWTLLEAAYTERDGGSRGRYPAQIALENAVRALMVDREQAADNFDMMTEKWGEAERDAARMREAASAAASDIAFYLSGGVVSDECWGEHIDDARAAIAPSGEPTTTPETGE